MEQILKVLIEQQQLQREEMQLVREQLQQIIRLGGNQQPVAAALTSHEDSVARRVKDLADLMVSFDYDPDNNATFDSWYKCYTTIFTIGVKGFDEPTKIQLMFQKFSHVDYQRFADSILPKEPSELTLEEAVKELKRLFGYKETKFSMRHKCFSIVKSDDEDFIKYAARVNKSAEKFDIKGCTADDLKVLLFVSGLKNPSDSLILEKLLAKVDAQHVQYEALADDEARATFRKLNLNDLVNEAQRILCLKKDKSTIGESGGVTEVSAVRQSKFRKSNRSKPSSSGRSSPVSSNSDFADARRTLPSRVCWLCGEHHWVKDCPFRDKQCTLCSKMGHKAGFCYSSINLSRRQCYGSDPGQGNKIHQVVESINVYSKRKFVKTSVNEFPIKFQFDTGSDITIISYTNWAKLGKPTLQPTNKRTSSASGDAVPLKGSFLCVIKLNGREKYGECYISTLQLNLFGIDWITIFDLWAVPITTFCNKVESNIEDELTKEVTAKFPLLFSEKLGCCTKTKATLTLKKRARPVYRNARPVPQAAASTIATELERLQHLGVIMPVEYSDSAVPIVVVKKKNGKICICADYSTGLNDNLQPNKYPLPTPDQIFVKIAGKKVFSLIDMSDAFFQVELDEKAK